MSDAFQTLCARLVASPTINASLADGNAALDQLFRDLIRAYAPPSVQFERERIIAQIEKPREIVFVLGLLSEGENEAALLLDVMCSIRTAQADAPIAHLVDEAWYYLRTSIDATWQLDDDPASIRAAVAYLVAVLHERLEELRDRAPAPVLADGENAGRAALLRGLRSEMKSE